MLRPEAGMQSISPTWVKGPNYLSHHLLSPRVFTGRKLESESVVGNKPRHSNVGCKHLNHYMPTTLMEGILRISLLFLK